MASFFGKLGNALQDTASFALPAGLTLAGAAATGGIGTPAILAALSAGGKGFVGNEQQERLRKQQLNQNRNTANANLINAFGGNARVQQAPVPRAGFLESLAGGAAQGIDAFQTAQMLQRQKEAFDRASEGADLDNQLKRQNIGLNQAQLQRQMGADIANQGGRVNVQVESFNNPGVIRNEVMDFADTGPPQAVQAGFSEQTALNTESARKLREQAEDRLLKRMDTLSTIEARDAGVETAKERLGLDKDRFGLEVDRLGIDRDRLGIERERLTQADRRLQRDIDNDRSQAMAQMATQEIEITDRILAATPSLKTADQVAANYLKVKALARDLLSADSKTRGAGMITLVNVTNRGFIDEGVAVRKEDIDNLRAAQSAYNTIVAEIQRFETGEALSLELVRNLNQTVEALYDAYAKAAQGTLNARLDSMPGVTVEMRERITDFLLAPIIAAPSVSMLEAERAKRNR